MTAPMSKHEQAVAAHNALQEVRNSLLPATRRLPQDGSPDPRNDKGHIHFNVINVGMDKATFSVDARYGEFGSSSTYTVTNNRSAMHYLAKAASKLAPQLANEAIRLAEQNMKEAAQAAAGEAKEILDIAKGLIEGVAKGEKEKGEQG